MSKRSVQKVDNSRSSSTTHSLETRMAKPQALQPNPVTSRERQPFLPDDSTPMESDGSQATVGGNRKILVVDDNAVVLKAFELKLQSSGFVVIPAKDGAT